MSTLDYSLKNVRKVFEDIINTGSPFSQSNVTEDDFKKAYANDKSITGYLPWMDIIDENKVLLDDAISVAAVYELTSLPTEARSEDFLISRRDAIEQFITGTFPEHNKAPWVVSTYSWKDRDSFRKLPEQVRQYAYDRAQERHSDPHPYTDWFIDNIFKQHIDDLSSKNGFFTDPLFSDLKWGGNYQKIYITFYRRNMPGIQRKKGQTPEKELDQQCNRVEQMFQSLGLKAQRLNGESIRNWLFLWFNPNPQQTNGDQAQYLQQNKYEEQSDDALADYDLSTDVMSRNVRSDAKTKAWYFDGLPHALLSVQRMSNIPKIGHLSAERYEGDSSRANTTVKCFVDQLPEGSVTMVTYTISPQTNVRRTLQTLEKSANGGSAEAKKTQSDIDHARTIMASRSTKLYPYSMAIAIRADDDDALEQALLETDTLLASYQFHAIPYEDDELMLDRYVRFLPMAYDPKLDQIGLRERIIYSHHLANILPLYGRSRGTGNPGTVSYNRGGEPVLFDPMKPGDRAKNAHLFIFGPTGAGKSSLLVYLQMFMTAIYFPRWITVEAGSSFNLLVEHFKERGLSVIDISLRPGIAPSLAPYKSALKLVDSKGNIIKRGSEHVDEIAAALVKDPNAETDVEEHNIDDAAISNRDILGELVIIARLMVTGGEEKEEERLTRADQGLLKDAILNAAMTSRKENRNEVLTEDVHRELISMTTTKPERRGRILEMADSMALFSDGFAGELFNRPGDVLPDADYIHIDMGVLASGNDNDKLSVAYISIVNQIVARAERTQRDGRQTINLTDEAHVITTNKLLAMYLVIVAKLMGRRMGLWLWQATQNMSDYKDDAKKMLAMFEWWIMLSITKDELEHIERFRELNDDQRQMLLSTRKVVPKYSEGVVFSSNVEVFFRNIPPPVCFALCMTEKHEKTERAQVMKKHRCTELEAVYRIAEDIRLKRIASLET